MKTKRSYNKAFPYRTITPITGSNTNSRLTHKNNNARNGTFARTFDHLINHYPPDEPVSKPFVEDYKQITKICYKDQEPLIVQPIWKTKGKNPTLSEDCLDVFVWSNFSMAKLYIPTNPKELTKINRQTRTLIWLTKMLYDYVKFNKFAGYEIVDLLSFNTKNDKAFSIGGKGTYPFMKSVFLEKPRIKKGEIKNIILGGGQNLLSPERRFDAIIYNTPSLFEEE